MDNTKFGGAVDYFKDRETLQRNYDKLEGRAITYCMKFDKCKCQILHLRQENLSLLTDWGIRG